MKKFYKSVFVLFILGCFLIVSCKDNIVDEAFSKLTVAFDANGGSGEMAELVKNKKGEIILSSGSFYREGYEFVGWNTASDGTGNTYSDGDVVNLTDNMTLYAQWLEEFEVIYNGNGSTSGEMNSQIIGKGHSCSVSDNTFIRTDYGFSGWNTASDGSGTSYQGGDVVVITEDLTLYAQWIHNRVSVTFDGNGSTFGSMEAQTVNTNTDTDLTENGFLKTGYHFDGWNTAADGTGMTYSDGDIVNIAEDLRLYAQWAGNTYSLSFDGNRSSYEGSTTALASSEVSEVPSRTVTNGLAYGDLGTPVMMGWTFDGWYTEATGGTNITSTTIADITGDQTLYAHWSETRFRIQLSKDSHVGIVMSSVTGPKYGQEVTMQAWQFATGYVFDRWTTTGGTFADAFNKTTTILMPAETITIHASSKPVVYTISYNLQGGEATNPTNYTIESEDITLNNPTRAGYTFTGWTGTNVSTPQISVTIAKGSTGNRSYTANWESNSCSITFNANGGNGTMGVQVVNKGSSTKLNMCTFNRIDYEFSHWTTEQDGSGYSYDDGETVTLSSDITLYAQWSYEGASTEIGGDDF